MKSFLRIITILLALTPIVWAQSAAQLSIEADDVKIRVQTEAEPANVDLSPLPSNSSLNWADEFDANVYPSARSAARALGRRWASEVAPNLKKPASAVLIKGPSRSEPGINEALAEGIRTSFPGIHVQVVSSKNPQRTEADAGSSLSGSSDPRRAVVRGIFEVRDQSRQMVLRLDPSSISPGSVNRNVNYHNRKWVEDLAEWATSQPHNQWVVAHSGDPRPSESQAREAAARAAADSLLPLLRSRLGPTRPGWGSSEDQYVKSILEAELAARQYVNDTFLQTFDRGYGTVYREAMLIDTSKMNMDRLSREVARRLERRRDTVLGMIASGGTMLIVVYLLYVLINWFTKGYFTWSLRTTAIVAACVGVLLILFLARF